MTERDDFRLSRVYAQGWNAAGKMTPAQRVTLERGGIAALNPYPYADKAERERWAEGFGRALGHDNTLPFRAADKKAPQ
jgi:hypothetical protein